MSATGRARPAQRQRQQGRHAAQLARRHASRASLEAVARRRRGRRGRHHRASARRPASHHAGRRARHRRRARAAVAGDVEFNIEGDPRPDLHRRWCTRCGPTSARWCRCGRARSRARPGGRPTRRADRCRRSCGDLRAAGVRVSLFVDPEEDADRWAAARGRRSRRAVHGAVRARVRAGRAATASGVRALRGRRRAALTRWASASTPATISISTTCRCSARCRTWPRCRSATR